jgi:uncharacterized protein (TIGR02391 family)
MNLETAVEPRLWEAVRASIEARQYTPAILDSIHLLTDVIRERSCLEGDGVALIGAAFGGNSPKLKVNRLQTESEQNIQRGMEAMLRGLYQAIRNPRSHEAHHDNERDANALLLFVDFLLRVVDQSGSPFSLATLVGRILDPDFVPSQRYAELLVGEIPPKKLLATCREVFARRAEGNNEKLQFFFAAALSRISADESDELCKLLSQELRETNDEATIRFVLSVFPSTFWLRLDEIARLRIENKLIASVKEGRWIESQRRCAGGAFGTWTPRIIRELTLKDELWQAIFNKLDSEDTAQQDYGFNYFTHYLDQCFEAPPRQLSLLVNKGLKAGDQRFKDLAQSWRWNAFHERKADDPWIKTFAEALGNFLERPVVAEMQEQDIPF